MATLAAWAAVALTYAWPATTPCTNTTVGDNYWSDPTDGAYVLNNHGSMPMIWISGTPANSGPGPLYTRTSKDPMFLASMAWTTDIRSAWDSLPMAALVSSDFFGGVQIGYSGGTGYANTTNFTSTGGGANCNVQGILTASSGVPNGIEYLWGAALTSAQSQGIGSGCTSTPTIVLTSPTGTGATITAYPTSVCGTYTLNPTGSPETSITSATCSDEYFDEMSQWATPPGVGSTAPIYQWFLNSFIDPPPNPAPKLPF